MKHGLTLTHQYSVEMVTIQTIEDGPKTVRGYAEFGAIIDGKAFNFVVHDDPDGVNKSLSHKESGFRATGLSVNGQYLREFQRAKTNLDRGILALDSLINKYGETRVRKTIERAPLLNSETGRNNE
jgi:hypothetical protein